MTASGPVFIVGCARSGTTLLRNLLRSHPSLAIPEESHFLALFHRAFGDPADDQEARALARRILGSQWVREWNVGLRPGDLAGHRSYAGLVRAIYEDLARREGKPRWGDKTPAYVLEMPRIHLLFPDARFIHVIRDGRDVCASLRPYWWGPRNTYRAASFWVKSVTAGRRDGARLPEGSYAETRYEELLADPEGTLRRLCEFIGEPFDAAVLTPSFARLPRRKPLWGRYERRVPSQTRIAADNALRWGETMSVDERAVFESVAGPLLAELGYEVEGLARPLRRTDEVRWTVQHHLRSLSRRANTRDVTWWRTSFTVYALRARAVIADAGARSH